MSTYATYAQQLKQLLPPGRLWSVLLGSKLSGLLEAIGTELARVAGRGSDFVNETRDPRLSTEMIDDWEELLELPDDCDEGGTQTLEERQLAAYQRLTSRGGNSPQFFIGMAAALGFEIQIEEFQFSYFRAGSSAGDYCYGMAWTQAWTVTIFVEDLVEQPSLECRIRRAAPKHTTVLFQYAEPSPPL